MDNIDEKILRRAYHKAALRNHPDKNTSLESHKKFQEIQDAYEFVCKYHGFADDDYSTDDLSTNDVFTNFVFKNEMFTNYTNIIYNFVEPLLVDKLLGDIKTKLWSSILNNIVNKCESKAFGLLNKLNRIQYGKIYDLLRSQKDTLRLSDEFLEKMDVLYKDKICEDEYIRIYPTIDDLYEDNLYKLQVGANTYYIPLWYHELVYDNSGAELFVLCIPHLEDGVDIDDKNDIHIEKHYELSEIWNMELIDISIGKKVFRIPKMDLKMMNRQVIKIAGAGISRMNAINIYDVSKKSDVYIHIGITE